MDRKKKLDLKDALRGAAETAQGKLDVHGVRDDIGDSPVYDRSKRNRRKSITEWLTEIEREAAQMVDKDKELARRWWLLGQGGMGRHNFEVAWAQEQANKAHRASVSSVALQPCDHSVSRSRGLAECATCGKPTGLTPVPASDPPSVEWTRERFHLFADLIKRRAYSGSSLDGEGVVDELLKKAESVVFTEDERSNLEKLTDDLERNGTDGHHARLHDVSNATLRALWLSDQLSWKRYTDELKRRGISLDDVL